MGIAEALVVEQLRDPALVDDDVPVDPGSPALAVADRPAADAGHDEGRGRLEPSGVAPHVDAGGPVVEDPVGLDAVVVTGPGAAGDVKLDRESVVPSLHRRGTIGPHQLGE